MPFTYIYNTKSKKGATFKYIFKDFLEFVNLARLRDKKQPVEGLSKLANGDILFI